MAEKYHFMYVASFFGQRWSRPCWAWRSWTGPALIYGQSRVSCSLVCNNIWACIQTHTCSLSLFLCICRETLRETNNFAVLLDQRNLYSQDISVGVVLPYSVCLPFFNYCSNIVHKYYLFSIFVEFHEVVFCAGVSSVPGVYDFAPLVSPQLSPDPQNLDLEEQDFNLLYRKCLYSSNFSSWWKEE